MIEKIKIIYLILGILFSILIIMILSIWISKQINWNFFTFNKQECISSYLYENYHIRDLSDESIEEVSQIGSLDKEEIRTIRDREIVSFRDYRKEVEKCVAEARKKDDSLYAGLSMPGEGCEKTKRVFALVGDFTKNKKPIINNLFLERLKSSGYCSRPSFLK